MTANRNNPAGAAGPPRREIATFTDYDDAERAVDFLSDQRFPVERVAIVGHDVQLVEQVTGRFSWGRAALSGAGSGALVGALVGWLFGLFDWLRPLVASIVLAGYGLVFGAVIGALFGLFAHLLSGGRRDFSSVRAMVPASYAVLADVDVAGQAAALLVGQRESGPAQPFRQE